MDGFTVEERSAPVDPDSVLGRAMAEAREAWAAPGYVPHDPKTLMVETVPVTNFGGPDDPDEIVASTDKGVFVKHLGGGQVNTATGDFVFGMNEAYMIEGGKLTDPLRSAQLIGNGPQALLDIDAVGSDFDMGSPGTCGKDGQGVPVGMGIPSLRVRGLTIGGIVTAAVNAFLRTLKRHG